MKRKRLLITLLVMVSVFTPLLKVHAQSRPLKTTDTPSKAYNPVLFYQLTEQDKYDYILTAGRPVVIKRDTGIHKLSPGSFKLYLQKEDVLTISVTLSNNSKDTLKYIGMQCSWWDSYEIDDPQISILQPTPCYKNGPTIKAMAPYSSSVVNLLIAVPKKLGKSAKFKIGMILQKYVDKSQGVDFSRSQPGNVIWTDEIQVP